MATEVVLDTYSGRPNPSWRLDAGQEREFLEQLESLEPQPDDQAEQQPPLLGHRGFEIQSPESGAGTIRVYGGTVQYGSRRYIDTGRKLERWLLGTAPSSLSKKLIQRIEEEIDGG
jgi:hypothetical protein